MSANYIGTDIDADGTPVVEVAPQPDTMTVVERTSTDFTGKIVFQESSGGRIFTINADGTELSYLATRTQLVPDGVQGLRPADPIGGMTSAQPSLTTTTGTCTLSGHPPPCLARSPLEVHLRVAGRKSGRRTISVRAVGRLPEPLLRRA